MKDEDPGFRQKLDEFVDNVCPRRLKGNWTTCEYRSVDRSVRGECLIAPGSKNGSSRCNHPRHPINLPLHIAVLEDL